MVNEDGGRLHQDCDQRNIASPRRDTIQSRKAAHKHNRSGDIDEVFGYDDGRAHEDFQFGVVYAAGGEERKPSRVNQTTNLAEKPAVICRQGRIVESPPLQVVKVPL